MISSGDCVVLLWQIVRSSFVVQVREVCYEGVEVLEAVSVILVSVFCWR